MIQPIRDQTSTLSKRIILVDDHAVVRAGLIEIFQRRPGFTVVGEAANASEAMRLVSQLSPDLVVVDVSLEVGMNGIELLKHLRTQHASLPILVLSMHEEDIYAERALNAGASGYLVKRAPIEQYYEAIDKVLGGRVYASAAVMEGMLGRGNSKAAGELGTLSDRELEVLELIGRGLGTREIATNLHLSVKTIETYRANLKSKLSLDSAPQLVRFAVQWVETR